MLVRAGPDAELLAVIADEGDKRALGLAREGPQIVEGGLGVGKGDGVTQLFEDREDGEDVAEFLGEPRAEAAGFADAGGAEKGVIDGAPAHAGARQGLGKTGLPDALGEPEPLGAPAEVALDRLAHFADLAEAVARRDAREDRLVVTAGEKLESAGLAEGAQAGDEIGVALQEKIEQRPRYVHRDAQARVALQDFDEREVGVTQGILENFAKVANRLVVMNTEDQGAGLRHGDSRGKAQS